ncbi:PAS domain S-box protein [Sphingobium amiense]|uniref:histidine kinase n=1 Tax=Sphingobium amiense TaxID=135719 RepID=A0A494W9A2_9SPHN|nr:ATP-binding protein [Sphingobium amiense]BBD96972.1 PAS domain S-box protein [Sphingobium amiense]
MARQLPSDSDLREETRSIPTPEDAPVLGARARTLVDALWNSVQESLVLVDESGRITEWNRASERIYGWSRRDVLGRLFSEIMGEQVRLQAGDNEGVEPGRTEARRTTACGREVILETIIIEQLDAEGRTTGWVESGIDVTRHRRAAWAAEAEQRHYRNVFHAIPASVWDIDFSKARATALAWLDGVDEPPLTWFSARPDKVRELMRSTFARDVNEQAMSLFGARSRDDLLVSIERYWPDDSIGDFTAWLVSALDGQPFFSCETRQRRYDGQEFDALFTASFAPGTVEEGRLVVSIVDRSEITSSQAAVRESEAFYTDMFNTSAFSAWHLDARETKPIYAELRANGVVDLREHLAEHPGTLQRLMAAIKVVDVNCTTLQLFEASEYSDIVGGPITRYWPPDRLDALIGSLEASFNDQPIYKSLTRMCTLKGKEIDVLFTRSASSALHSAGQLLLAIVDMTDKVQAENALAEMQATLAHAARISSLGELTASIAHEVNQPLAAITANGEAALLRLQQPAPALEQLRQLTEEMISDARRASDVVAHIRSLASPQSGEHLEVCVNSIVREALTLVGSQLERCGVAAVLELKPGPAVTLGNAVQLQQVLVNLILNALHAARGRPGARVVLGTSESEDVVVLTVEDNGTGIPPEIVGRLFDSFFTTKADGMGIGLAICRTIVEAHGGEISAANIPSGGARFTVRLPRAGHR